MINFVLSYSTYFLVNSTWFRDLLFCLKGNTDAQICLVVTSGYETKTNNEEDEIYHILESSAALADATCSTNEVRDV